MKIERVLRYTCDFCGRSGCGKYAMIKHEKYCTMNPNRECRMCKFLGKDTIPINELIDALPEIKTMEYDFGTTALIEVDLEAVKKSANYCPACILAAIKQAGHCAYEFDFDYKEECKLFWEDLNKTREPEWG